MPATATPPAPTAPAAPPQPSEMSTMNKAFEAIESHGRMPGEAPTIGKAPAQKRPVGAKNAQTENRIIRPGEAPDPDDAKPATPATPDGEEVEAPAASPDEKPVPKEAPPAAKQKKPADFLREDREKQIKRAEAAEARLKEFEAQFKDAQSKAARLEEYEKKVAAIEKRNQEIEDNLRLTNYERSEEYKSKYEKPFFDAYQRGRAKVASLEVTDSEGNIRAAKPEDFDAIMQVTNDRQASRLAREMFGDDAPIVIHHRERVLEANQARINAVEESKKNAGELEKQRQEQSQKAVEASRAAFNAERKEASEKLEWFKSAEGDDEWNTAIKTGVELSEKAFSPPKDGETPEETAKRHAAIFNRAAAYSPMKLKIKRLTAELAEAKKALEQYQSSAPGKGEGEGRENGSESNGGGTLESIFSQIEGKARSKF